GGVRPDHPGERPALLRHSLDRKHLISPERSVRFANKSFLPRFFTKKRAGSGAAPRRVQGGALAGPRNGTTKRRNDMIYKDFQGLKLSTLGMGCMRLPRNSASDADVNEAETARMVACDMERGVNYYDTAWGYHEGNSETVMGRVLAKYPRESFYLVTKFPGYDLANMPKVKEIFPRQLEKCGVDYFDFYLIHNVCEMNIDAYLDPQYGIMDYLLEQKAQGRIRHLGFSAHGSYEVMKRFLDAYADNMESCQLQLHAAD